MTTTDSFNCSQYSNHVTEHYYCGIFENKPLKTFSVIAATIIILLDVAMFFGIIWYERFGSDNQRTLVNKLLTSICWISIGFFIICLLDVIRFTIGPLPSHLCLIQMILKSIFKTTLLLYLNAMNIAQYFLVVWMKNPSRLKDDFWSCFLSLWITMASTMLCINRQFLPGKYTFNYYSCADINYKLDDDAPFKMNYFIEIPTIICHILIIVRIHLYKKSLSSEPVSQNVFQKSFYLKFLEKQTISDFVSTFIGVVGLLLFFIVGNKIRSTKPHELNIYPNYLLVYVQQLFFPGFLGMFCIFMVYSRHPPLKEKLRTEVFNLFTGIKEFFN